MKQKDILTILIPIFLLTVLWVIFNIYHNYVTSTIKSPLDVQIISIESEFDNAVIEKIKERQRINPLYEIQNQEEINTTESTQTQETDESASDSADIVLDEEFNVNLDTEESNTDPNQEL